MVSAKRIIAEMIGATNWWLDKNGHAHMVFGSHAELAQQQTGVKFTAYGPDSQKGWQLQGKAYELMYRKGWVRVSFKATERRMQIEFRGAISRKAMEWLQDTAFERQAVIVDDHGRIYADFRPEDEQRGIERYRPEHIVEILLETDIDAKELAMRAPAHDYDRTVVWLRSTDEEVPVGLNAEGFFYHDAAYILLGQTNGADYSAIMNGILAELDAGKETGDILGVKWALLPCSLHEPTGQASSQSSPSGH